MSKLKALLHWLAMPPLPIAVSAVILGIAVPLTSLALFGGEHILTYIGYALSAYALTVLSFRMPQIIALIKQIKRDDGIIGTVLSDPVLKIRYSVAASLVLNTAYAALNAGIALIYHSLWSAVIGVYYILLSLLRLLLFKNVRRLGSTETQLKRCRIAGLALLLMHAVLVGMIFYITRHGSATPHGEITTIALALYTFVATAVAVVGLVKYKRLKTPVFSVAKEINLAAALVSVLMLERAMLSTFGDGDEAFSRIMISATGGVIAVFVLGLALYTVIGTTIKLKKIRTVKNER